MKTHLLTFSAIFFLTACNKSTPIASQDSPINSPDCSTALQPKPDPVPNEKCSTHPNLRLNAAFRYGCIEQVRTLLAEGKKVGCWDSSRESELLIALKSGHYSLAKFALDAGAKPDGCWFERPPLLEAVARGRVDLLELLLESGAKPDTKESHRNPLYWIAHKGDSIINFCGAKALIDRGADPNPTYNSNALFWASARGSFHTVKLLIDHGVDLNTYSPLHVALKNNHVDVADLLLNRGASLTANVTFFQNYFPLNYSIHSIDLFEKLLAAGASIQTKNLLYSPPMPHNPKPAIWPSYEVAKRLIESGYDINDSDGEQVSALEKMAAHIEDYRVPLLLIENGANPTMAVGREAVKAKKPELFRALVEKHNLDVHHKWSHGQTLLLFFSETINAHIDNLRLLISKNVDLDQGVESIRTPLTQLIKQYPYAHPKPDHDLLEEKIRLLLEAGADPNHGTYRSLAPLPLIIYSSPLEHLNSVLRLAKLMLKKGADPNYRSPGGLSVLQMAKNRTGFERMVVLLKEFGAEE